MSSTHLPVLRVLLVSASPILCQTIRLYLSKDSNRCYVVTEQSSLIGLSFHESQYDLILLGEPAQDESEEEFQKALGKQTEIPVPIVYIYGERQTFSHLEVLRRGIQEAFHLETMYSADFLFVLRRVLNTSFLQRDYQRLTQDLMRSQQAFNTFAYAVSHDLREPLRKVSHFGELLQDSLGHSLDSETQRYLDRMMAGTQRMSEMMQAISLYSQMTGPMLHMEWLSSLDLIQNAFKDLDPLFKETQACVEKEGIWPEIWGEPKQIRHLLFQLLSNAVKFHKSGQKPLVRLCSARGSQDEWILKIQDDGIGFAEHLSKDLFVLFRRLHQEENLYGGHGVGLAISKQIVENHGGNLTVQSQPQKGALFQVQIPTTRWLMPDA